MDTGKSRSRSNGKAQSTSGASAIVVNPAAGHSSSIDNRVGQWSRTHSDILTYLSSVDEMAAFADRARNSEELANRIQPFLDNAERYMKSLSEIAEGQASWTEIRKRYGGDIANAIAKIRKFDAQFNMDMEVLDAKDRATMTEINAKRQNLLRETAAGLDSNLKMEMLRHQNRMEGIADTAAIAQQRAAISDRLRSKRRNILERVSYGNRGRDALPLENIPVSPGGLSPFPAGSSRRRADGPYSGVSASGENRGGFSGIFRGVADFLRG